MTRRPLISSGIFLGVGLGGFLDGIIFHQIFQLHSLMSAKYPKTSLVNYQINMAWDGLFHLFTWIMTVIGLITLWSLGKRNDVPRCGRTYLGSLLLGWGSFNLVEGVIDHHILHIHHVVESLGESVWDYVFLASAALLVVTGLCLIARVKEEPPRPHV